MEAVETSAPAAEIVDQGSGANVVGSNEPSAGPQNADVPEGESTEQAPVSEDVNYDFKMPEGFEITDQIKSDVYPVFKKYGVSQEDAQFFVDMYCQEVARTVRGINEQSHSDMERERAGWAEAVRRNPEYGGNRLKASLVPANNLLRKYASQEMINQLVDTGLASHPAFVDFFIKAGRAMSEDRYVDASRRGSTEPTLEGLGRSVFSKSLADSERY